MIYPFHPEDLKGATYSVRLTGLSVRYIEDDAGKIEPDIFCIGKDDSDLPNALENQKRYKETDDIILKPNSITYVTLEPVFQVPEYLALRFNLKISNVYKGLLLGTGPIIDPGFQGRLSIPLHNLTSNEYTFSAGDTIIYLEITKISPHSRWEGCRVKNRWATYVSTEIDAHRQVTQYVRDALKGVRDKHVVSSITAATNDVRTTAKDAAAKVDGLEKTIQRFTLGGVIGVIVAIAALCAALLMPTFQLIKSVTDTQENYARQIEALETELDELRELLMQYGIEENGS